MEKLGLVDRHRFWPDRNDLLELLRPWKLLSFGLGMSWLLYGALNYEIADWDVGISLIMGGLTYICAPWSVQVILNALRNRPNYWPLHIVTALVVAWFVVDGVYWMYHTMMNNTMYRPENFTASLALYFLAGTIWLYRGSLWELMRQSKSLLRDEFSDGIIIKDVFKKLLLLGVGLLILISFPVSCVLMTLPLSKLAQEKLKVEIEGEIPDEYPVLVVFQGDGEKSANAETVYYRYLDEVKQSGLEYSFLVPQAQEADLQKKVEEKCSRHLTPDGKDCDDWLSTFEVKYLEGGRQALSVHKRDNDDVVNTSWYIATEKEIIPQKHSYYC